MAEENQQTNLPAPEQIQPQTVEWPKPNTAADLITRGLNSEPISKPKKPDNIKGS